MRLGIHTISTFAILFLLSTSASAQKKKSADGAYWQQQADYEITVTLADDGRTISGSQTLIYTNNSPDTLDLIYLKAFANSARKGSLMDLRRRDEENYSILDADSSQYGSLTISNVTGRGKKALKFELDDTIYKITLGAPIIPGATARIDLDFVTVLPVSIGDRHEYIAGQSKAAYWYPQICAYDAKFGWVNAPYVGRGECYGDFGDFTVSITAPEDRVIAATGLLTNQKQALPDSLRKMLDITKFLGEPDTWPEFNFDTTKTRTWNFFAKKVNDFAFVAGKDFCIDETTHNGIKIEIYPKRSKAKNWTEAKRLAIESLETFSELYGDYGWPAIKVTDSYDGMEYPMITFCSGDQTKPFFFHLVYHEIGHFWFMGLVGSNQVDRPFLDEGFTTMAEIVAMEKYRGRKGNNVNWSHSWYKRNFYPLDEDRDDRGYRIYLPWVKAGYDLPMIISSDNASEYWAYRNSSYYKPVMMHFTLRAIYGDDLYFDAMHNYGSTWRFKHPYEDDFVNSFSSAVDERLDEYFEQWLSSRKQIDYKYHGHKRLEGDTYRVTVSKPGDFVTPIDIALIANSGDTVFYTVNPEGHDFIKPGYNNAGTWSQYRRPSRKYSFEATVPSGIKKAVIDPRALLPDVNRLNNESGFFPPTETKFDAMVYDIPSMHKYSVRWRPDLWFDDVNGVMLGAHIHGSYIKTGGKFSLDALYGTRSERPAIDFSYSNPYEQLGRLAFTEARLLYTDYRLYTSIGVTKEFRKRWTGPNFVRFEGYSRYLDITTSQFSKAAPFNSEIVWSDVKSHWFTFKSTSNSEGRTFQYYHSQQVDLAYRVLDDDGPAFAQFQSTHKLGIRLSKSLKLNLSGRYFSTSRTLRSEQFAFHISRPRPIDAFTQGRIFRAPGTVPNDLLEDVYLASGGLRGYQNRALYGREGEVFSASLTFPRILKHFQLSKLPIIGTWLNSFNNELFVQTGEIHQDGYAPPVAYETPISSKSIPNYSSAGISFTSPSVWNKQRVRIDFPLYLSRPLLGEEKWEFRVSAAWILPLPTAKWVR